MLDQAGDRQRPVPGPCGGLARLESGEGEAPMTLLDDIRATMRQMLEPKPPVELKLLVSTTHFDQGEAWVREAYQIGPDIEIIESVPLPRPGQSAKVARRYPSALQSARS
jgi:hypothetical protein